MARGTDLPQGASAVTRAALFSMDSYFEQAELAAASVKLLALVARRHVDAELVFDDSMYRLRARSRSQTERSISADIAAMPERDLEAATALLPLKQSPCVQMVPLELALAALVNAVTADPVLVFWEKGEVLISLRVVAGMVQTRMRENVTEASRSAVLERARISLMAGAGRDRELNEVIPCLYSGDLRDLATVERDAASEHLENKLQRLYRCAERVEKDCVLRDPELFGLPYVCDGWSFLDKDYRRHVQAWRYARPAAAAAGVAGLAFALYGGVQHLQAMSLATAFDRQRGQLSADMAKFESARPSAEAMASVRNRLAVQRQSVNEVRLDNMLHWLTHLLPQGVSIKAMELVPLPAPRRRNREAAEAHPPGEKPFALDLQIVLAETALDRAEASAAEVVRRLSQRLDMVDSRLEVPAPEPGVRRNVVLVVKAHARAVKFS